MQPVRLGTKVLDKVWGSPLTQPWFQNPDVLNVGEVWFEAPAAVPLLVKFLFTSESLSVQVHPADVYAKKHENGSCGKTEMWHILRAEPGAQVAVGLTKPVTRSELREAAISGEIVSLLHWVQVRPGDTFFVPAGAIHAIGRGLALCEVQQVSDVTYRLYDFGRGRDLHLDRGLDVADLEPREAHVLPTRLGPGRELLAECGYFRTERLHVQGTAVLEPRNVLCVVLAGEGLIGGAPFRAGEAWDIGAASAPVLIQSPDASFLITQTHAV